MQAERIRHYFPDLSDQQYQQFEQLYPLYHEWNARINVISRKDLDQFYERHVLHSLAIARLVQFVPGTLVLDIGTGGGFPGIPLAILFPETQFTLVDSIGKKITVVKEVAAAIGLNNVSAHHERVEKIPGEFDFIVSRAVAPLEELASWTIRKLIRGGAHNRRNGFLLLKGGDLAEETETFRRKYRDWKVDFYPLSKWYEEDFFETKQLLHVWL